MRSIKKLIKRKCTKAFKALFLHLPLDRSKIFVCNFSGAQGYGDNPKCIVDELLKQDEKYKIIWLTKDMSVKLPDGVTPVLHGSLRSFYESSTAKFWIFNQRNVMITKKRSDQIYLHTLHGFMAVKRVEREAEDKISPKYIAAAKKDGAATDAIIVESLWREQLAKNYFWLKDSCAYLKVGSPKVDDFLSMLGSDSRAQLRAQIGVDNDDFVVLYAPTFRNVFSREAFISDFRALKAAFEANHPKVRLFIRLHPNWASRFDELFGNSLDCVTDMTKYPDLQELLAASDCVISDYSSVPFIFLLSRKPVFIYAADYDAYDEERGINELFKLQPFPVSYSMSELEDKVRNFNEADYAARVQAFLNDFPMYNNGTASKQVVQWLKDQGLKSLK